MSKPKVYLVQSTYKVTGGSYIVATSAVEAQRIGLDGYPDGGRPEFDFSDAHSESAMRAVPALDESPSPVTYPNGGIAWPVRPQPAGDGAS